MIAGWLRSSREPTSFRAARIFSTFFSSDQSRYSSFLYGISPMMLLSLHLACYAPDHVPRDVAGDFGVLLETTGGVLVPVLPEGYVDPELVSSPDEDTSELLVHAQEHLELVAVFGDFELVDQPEGVPDQELVVRRYADVDATFEQLVEQENVVLADGIEILVGY